MEVKVIHECILKAVPGAEIYIRDLTGGGDHFEAFVISASFEGKPLFQQHRQVMDSVKELMAGPLHALTIKTYTPQKWEDVQAKGF